MSDEEEPADQYSSALEEFCGFGGVGGLVAGQDSYDDDNPLKMKPTDDGEMELANANVIASPNRDYIHNNDVEFDGFESFSGALTGSETGISFGAFDNVPEETGSNDWGGFSAFNDGLATEAAGSDKNASGIIDSGVFDATPNDEIITETVTSPVLNDEVDDPHDSGGFSAFGAAVVSTKVSQSFTTESIKNESQPNNNDVEANDFGGFSAFDNSMSTTDVTQSNPIASVSNEAEIKAEQDEFMGFSSAPSEVDQVDQSPNNSGLIDSNQDGFSAFDVLSSSREVAETDSTLQGVPMQSVSDDNKLSEPQTSTFNAIPSSESTEVTPQPDEHKQDDTNGFLACDTEIPAPTVDTMKKESELDSNDEFGDFSEVSHNPVLISEDNNLNHNAGKDAAVLASNNETDEFTGFTKDESTAPHGLDMTAMPSEPALITTNDGATDAPSEAAQEVPSEEIEFAAGVECIQQEPISDLGHFSDMKCRDDTIINDADAANVDVDYLSSAECKEDNTNDAENLAIDTNESDPVDRCESADGKNEDRVEAVVADANYLSSSECKEDTIDLGTENDGDFGSFADFEEGVESPQKINLETDFTSLENAPLPTADADIKNNAKPVDDELEGFTSFEEVSGPDDAGLQAEDEDFGDFEQVGSASFKNSGHDATEGNEHSIPDESQECTPNNQQMFEEADGTGDFAAFEDTSTPGIGNVEDNNASELKDKSEPPMSDDDFGDFAAFEDTSTPGIGKIEDNYASVLEDKSEPPDNDDDFGDFAAFEVTSTPGVGKTEDNHASVLEDKSEPPENDADFGDFAAFEDTSTPDTGYVEDDDAFKPNDKSEPPENDDDFGEFGDFEEFSSEPEQRPSNERTAPATVLNESVRIMFETVFEMTSQLDLNGSEGLELPFDVLLSSTIVSFVCV
eukprot:scaffold5294_cov72-Cyclotella_meneghiniana.AAC.5